MNNIKKISITFFLLLALLMPAVSRSETPPLSISNAPGTSAENPLVPCGGVDASGKAQPKCDIGHLNKILESGLNLVFIFAGLIVASMFMYAGFLMITAAGNTSQIQKAREIFRRVVVGFIIMFMSFILVKNLLQKIDADRFFLDTILGDKSSSNSQSNSSRNAVSVIDKNKNENTAGKVIERQVNNSLPKSKNDFSVDNKMDIKKEFGLENLSNDSVKKIEDKIEWLKQRAKGETGLRKGEDVVFIKIDPAGNVSFYEKFTGLNGGSYSISEIKDFFIKNPNGKVIELHTHDYETTKKMGLMCEAEGINKCNPDNPPSISDFEDAPGFRKSYTNNYKTYVVEQDGDMWRYSYVPGSKLSQYSPLNDVYDEINEEIKKLENKRLFAETYSEANNATNEYLKYLRSIGAEIVKIPAN